MKNGLNACAESFGEFLVCFCISLAEEDFYIQAWTLIFTLLGSVFFLVAYLDLLYYASYVMWVKVLHAASLLVVRLERLLGLVPTFITRIEDPSENSWRFVSFEDSIGSN